MHALLRNLLLLSLPMTLLAACSDAGKVEQGRAVAFDKEKKTVTIIRDAARDPAHPRYDLLPPAVFELPTGPREMGPEPKTGLRLGIDPEGGHVVLYNPANRTIDRIPVRIVARHAGVDRTDPLVQGKTFPAVDPDTRIVTIYSGRDKLLLSFLPPEPYRELRPEDWDAGDEVRIYFREDGKALRLMNVSRTDIFQK